MPWIDRLFESLLIEYPIPDSLQILPAHQLPSPRARISLTKEGKIEELLPIEPATRYHLSTLIENKRITSDNWNQDVRHLIFQFDEDLE